MGKCITRFISDADVKKMRTEAINILEEVGVKVSHEGAKQMLEKAGAKVDYQTDLVKIPGELSEECLRRLPGKVVLGGRQPDKDVVLEPGNERVYNRGMSGGEYYIDLQDGKYRKAVLSDVKDWAIATDGTKGIDICCMPYYYDPGLNVSVRDVHGFEILLENTTKPIELQPYGKKNIEYMIEMCLAEYGSKKEFKKRPRFMCMIGPVSPLHWHGNSVDMLLLAGQYGIPVEPDPMPIAGAGGPVTILGNTLLSLAEHLSAVVISELANPGAPVIFAPRPVAMNMATGQVIEASVEVAMISAIQTQVAREGFGWPTDMYAFVSDSPVTDGQSIIDRCFNATFCAFAGADILTGWGCLEASITLDIVQLAIDSEIADMTARALKGVEVNDDTLGLEAIRRVGAGTGNTFLTDPHTIKYFKTEYRKPQILTYARRKAWEAEGRKDLYERAKEKVKRLLSEHKPAPADAALVKEWREITERAEKEIVRMSTV
ncbi:MAG: trimethylamine methyltransferase family protein [Chloroflexi bacterium]|nr:trimethylamine methyltransferase family protein [Chloroflexota bacterium]